MAVGVHGICGHRVPKAAPEDLKLGYEFATIQGLIMEEKVVLDLHISHRSAMHKHVQVF